MSATPADQAALTAAPDTAVAPMASASRRGAPGRAAGPPADRPTTVATHASDHIVVKQGYIFSIMLEHYPFSLAQRCADKTRPLDIDISKCIKGIADALVHLHDQGYCVKPDNIVLKADDTPVLIDFDSCLPINQALGKGTTKGWGDDESKTSSVKNDWLGLALVEEHLRKTCVASPLCPQ